MANRMIQWTVQLELLQTVEFHCLLWVSFLIVYVIVYVLTYDSE